MRPDRKEMIKNLRLLEDHFPNKEQVCLKGAIEYIEKTTQAKVDKEIVIEYLKAKGYKVIIQDDEPDIDEILNMKLERNEDEDLCNSNFDLLRDYHLNQDKKSFWQLIANNIKLVQKIALRYQQYISHKLTFEDLVGEGIHGLVKAVEKFDLTKGYSFSTYAFWWIRQSILRAIIEKGTTIRIPVHMIELIMKVNKAEQKCLKVKEEIDIDVICNELGITREKYQEIKTVEYRFIRMPSLNSSVSDDETKLGEMIGTDKFQILGYMEQEYNDPVHIVIQTDIRNRLFEALDQLTERQRSIIIYRFGLLDGQQKTLEEVGQIFGLTRERIRQIESKALNRMAQILREKEDWV